MISASDTLEQRRRLRFLTGALFVSGALLVFRLGYIQIGQHARYLADATSEQTRKFEIPAARGQLFVQDGDGTTSPIAMDQTLDIVYADPRYVMDKATTASRLAAAIGGSASQYETELNNGIDYVELATRVPLTTGAQIEHLGLPGIGLTQQSYRIYPEGSLAAQVLGFVNTNGVGQYGLEQYLNKQLSGTPGRLAAKTDTYGIPIATADNVEQPAVNGTSYVLTIDRNIQAEAEKEIAAQVQKVHAKSGSIVITNPNNGDVLAMATYPTFDPNNYGQVSDYDVFLDQPAAEAFEPGSGMKVFTMAAGLDQGKVTPNTTYNDPGCYTVDSRQICNAAGDKAGPNKTMTVVLRDSLNTGAMFVLRMLSGNPNGFTLAGKQLLYSYLTKHFGFGTATGVAQSDEAAGFVPKASNVAGNNSTYATMTFGQGMTVTMLQMVDAIGAVANGGTLYAPQLIAQQLNPDGSTQNVQPKVLGRHIMSPSAISQLNQMLQVVVQHGSGYLAADENPGYAIAGKTGTAQVSNPNGTGYLTGVNIGSFLGYAPASDPKFAMMVRINDPSVQCDTAECGYAEYTTVPVFGDMCKWLFKYYGIPPTS